MSEHRRAPTVAVVGSARLAEADPRMRLAEQLGRCLVDRGYCVVTGGLGGVMEAVSRGGRSSPSWHPGAVVGILPGHDPTAANPFVGLVLPTGMDLARNMVVAHADALVAIGGGAGTLSEIALGWQLHRLLLAFRVDGWSGRLADSRIDDRVRYADIEDDRVYGVDAVGEAVDLIGELLPRYQRRHRGVPT